VLRVLPHGDVLQLELSSWVGRRLSYRVSAYVAHDVLIDSGFPRAARELTGWIAARAVALHGGVITHWHEDHSGGVPALTALGMPLALHPVTEEHLRRPPRLESYRRLTWGSFVPLTGVVQAFAPDERLEIHSMPGHTPDHRVVWDATTGSLFAGDLYLGVKVRLAHEGEDFRALIESLRACAVLDPARMFCAHRGLVPNAKAALRAKADWLEETVTAVAAAAGRGLDDAAIVREVLGGEELTGLASQGHYSRRAFVAAARRAAQ
jgi:endoribonuclease LACTB2